MTLSAPSVLPTLLAAGSWPAYQSHGNNHGTPAQPPGWMVLLALSLVGVGLACVLHATSRHIGHRRGKVLLASVATNLAYAGGGLTLAAAGILTLCAAYHDGVLPL